MKKYFKILLLAVISMTMVLFLADDPFEYSTETLNRNNNVIKKQYNSNINKRKETDMVTDVSATESKYPIGISNVEGVSSNVQNPEYWIKKLTDGNKTIMTNDQIDSFNEDIYKNISSVVKLQNYGNSIQGNTLTSYINSYTMPNIIYNENGVPIKSDTKQSIISNLNLNAIKPSNEIKFGIVVRKTSVRSFPTDISAHNSTGDNKLDRFQQTGCGACEMVAVLHESKDSAWYFVQTINYKGWVPKQDIALVTSKKEAVDYVDSKNFIVINSDYISLKFKTKNGQDFSGLYLMGTKIPIDGETKTGYIANIPIRDNLGNVYYEKVLLSKGLDISKGYLPYTRSNIITQVFKLNGADYDWGDKYTGRDCSSFILSVYKTFGFNLPRDTNEQEKIPGKVYSFNKNTFNNIKPGAAIYMDGHVVMYLGKDNDQNYIIHSFLGYKPRNKSAGNFIDVYKVSITNSDILNSSGIPYTDKFIQAIQMEK